MSAATLNVGVGFFSDPEEAQGIAISKKLQKMI